MNALEDFYKRVNNITPDEMIIICNDIRIVEQTLFDCKINCEFNFREIPDLYGILSWGFYQKERKFRLLWEEISRDDNSIFSLPVIECKFKIRTIVHSHLSNFLRAFADYIEENE